MRDQGQKPLTTTRSSLLLVALSLSLLFTVLHGLEFTWLPVSGIKTKYAVVDAAAKGAPIVEKGALCPGSLARRDRACYGNRATGQ